MQNVRGAALSLTLSQRARECFWREIIHSLLERSFESPLRFRRGVTLRYRGEVLISHLHGRLARKNEASSSIEIDANGVWYEVELPAFVWRALEDRGVGEEIDLETYYFLTQNAPIPRLIGFQREVEREFFKKLITVPNVGPTTATRALAFSVSTIAGWIEAGDTAALGRLPAIGKRSAETIVA